MLRILHDTKYDFIKYWKQSVIGTIAFIVLGFILLGVHAARFHGEALNYSVEFTGGTVVQLHFAQPAQPDVVRSSVDAAGFAGSEVTTFGTPTDYVIKSPPKEGATSAENADSVGAHIADILKQRMPDNPATVQQAQSVGPRVGAELKTK